MGPFIEQQGERYGYQVVAISTRTLRVLTILLLFPAKRPLSVSGKCHRCNGLLSIFEVLVFHLNAPMEGQPQ